MTMTTTTDFISLLDLEGPSLAEVLDLAERVKAEPARWARALAGRSAVLLFEKPSLRTRVTFEVGVAKLGGLAMYFEHTSSRIGEREPIVDYGRNLERWVDVIVARVFDHATLTGLAEHAGVPVVNALSDHEHPCQALADMLTLRERLGRLEGARLAYVGDGNNVCHSLMLAAARLGVDMVVITPDGYAPDPGVVDAARAHAARAGQELLVTPDLAAVAGADAVYTDTWVSMGQDDQASTRNAALRPYQVTQRVMARAGEGAIFMHCLPAHRGMEVAAEVIDGPHSAVYDQAENRMHAQNALLLHLLDAKPR